VETERVDSVYVYRTDTLTQTLIQQVFDSVWQDRNTSVTVNTDGDTIREVERIETHHYHSDNSLIAELRARCDSLTQLKQKTVQVPYPVEAQLTRWQKVKQEVGGVAIGVLLVAVCVTVVWLTRRYHLKKSA
jgi:hypothetical protein